MSRDSAEGARRCRRRSVTKHSIELKLYASCLWCVFSLFTWIANRLFPAWNLNKIIRSTVKIWCTSSIATSRGKKVVNYSDQTWAMEQQRWWCCWRYQTDFVYLHTHTFERKAEKSHWLTKQQRTNFDQKKYTKTRKLCCSIGKWERFLLYYSCASPKFDGR